METIGISPRFFKHELNGYSDWKRAFWRELVQNSVDEKCTKINVTIVQESGRCVIQFDDNGPGMNEEIMRNVYFQLGATGKESADTIGGHGRARILTCFAHDQYEIRTQNILCKGEGGSFEIDNTQPVVKGCKVSVWISEAYADSMENALKGYLSNCQLPCTVIINDEPYGDWLYRRKATRTLPFGTIHTTKARPNYTIVRVRGVAMFERYSGCPTGTILEIEAAQSREILTVSRDQLKYEAQKVLDEFIAEITIDHRSINRDCAVNKTEVFGKFRKLGVRAAKEKKEAEQQSAMRCTGDSEVTFYGNDYAYQGAAYIGYTEGTSIVKTEPEPVGPTIPFSVHYEDAPKNILASAKRFHADQISGNRLKLLAAWDATLEHILEAMEEWKEDVIMFMPGFCFGNCLGLHKEQKCDDEKGHILYINPLDSTGKIRISCHDYAELYAIGLHECSHILQRYHDEDYASVLTEMITRTSGKMNELKTRVREAVANIAKTEGGQLELIAIAE